MRLIASSQLAGCCAELKAEVADQVFHPAERKITGKEFHVGGALRMQGDPASLSRLLWE
jgi:hypothetical protein